MSSFSNASRHSSNTDCASESLCALSPDDMIDWKKDEVPVLEPVDIDRLPADKDGKVRVEVSITH